MKKSFLLLVVACFWGLWPVAKMGDFGRNPVAGEQVGGKMGCEFNSLKINTLVNFMSY